MPVHSKRSPALLLLTFFAASASALATTQAPSPLHGMVVATRAGERASVIAPSTRTVAERLRKRIAKRFGIVLDLRDIAPAVDVQRRLFRRSVAVRFRDQNGRTLQEWPGGLQENPQWLRADVSPAGLSFALDTAAIAVTVRDRSAGVVPLPMQSVILSVTKDADGILRAETTEPARAGYALRHDAVAGDIARAILKDTGTVDETLTEVPGIIRNASDADLGTMQLLAQGRSNFAGSGNGRKMNVRKGLARYLNDVVVPSGEEFSINAILRNVPIGEWEMALGIFGGGELRPVAGGGLCQVATTLYRGILNAGLPVTRRASHSLFVHYYEMYGVGIDATIFPGGGQDLRFVNDTGNAILIQAFSDGDEATVNLYGTPDGRSARLEGPYFSVNAPQDFPPSGKKLRSSDIGWRRIVTRADGATKTEAIVSHYKTLPRSVVQKYAEPSIAEELPPLPSLHGSAAGGGATPARVAVR